MDDDEKKLALLGFDATTGNDYVSSLFRQGKKSRGRWLKSTVASRQCLVILVIPGKLLKSI